METKKEFDQVEYLKNQLKYLGFGEGEKLHKDLEKGINSKKQQFEIKTTSDKALPGNKVDFTLKFNKYDQKIANRLIPLWIKHCLVSDDLSCAKLKEMYDVGKMSTVSES